MTNERLTELQPSFDVTVFSVEDRRPPHVLVCVHGMRDNGAWCSEVEAAESIAVTAPGRFVDTRFVIACASYDRQSTVDFLLGLRRSSIQAQVLDRIRSIREQYSSSPISILCHSNGTKVVADLMSSFNFKVEWLFLCGSVCRLDDVRELRKVTQRPVNDAAPNDPWPILAEVVRPGLYKATGVFGFHCAPVIERMFRYYRHGGGTGRAHIEKWVLPTIVTGAVERTLVPDLGWRKHLPTYLRRTFQVIGAGLLYIMLRYFI